MFEELYQNKFYYKNIRKIVKTIILLNHVHISKDIPNIKINQIK